MLQTGRVTAQARETVLYSFAGSDGADPEASLIDVNGILYGTTAHGGTNGVGTVFKITPSGTESVIYSFAGGSDGANPYAGLTNVSGVLCGTTFSGGANGVGTVFEITPSGAESVLYSFLGKGHGANPGSGLTDLNGVLYGTTSSTTHSGDSTVFKITTNCGGVTYDTGTVFTITTSGAKSDVYRFGGSDGLGPVAGLTNVNGVLYGTTNQGGANNKGTVFSLSI
jgi:uncharacterized repeat protein (TIGR03803 family)